MKFYRITEQRFANDLSGKGAALYPGRWNQKNVPVPYAASSLELACQEKGVRDKIFTGFCVQEIEIDENDVSEFEDIPMNWNADPPQEESRNWATEKLVNQNRLAIRVPTKYIGLHPLQYNIVINTNHNDYSLKVKIRNVSWDGSGLS